jgi:hypothetical protein
MERTCDETHRLLVIGVRGVRVANTIGERMMAPVVRDPTVHAPLKAERTAECKGDLDPSSALEGPMREHPVITGGQSVARQRVEDHKQHEIENAHTAGAHQGQGAEHDSDDRAKDDQCSYCLTQGTRRGRKRWLETGEQRRGGLHLIARRIIREV